MSLQKNQEVHEGPHIRVRWHVDVLVDGHDFYQGIVKDITENGAEIFLDVNLPKAKPVKLRIHVPPLSKTSPPVLMEISGKILFSAYDGSESLFHTHINFLQFKQESDHAYLHSRIAELNRVK